MALRYETQPLFEFVLIEDDLSGRIVHVEPFRGLSRIITTFLILKLCLMMSSTSSFLAARVSFLYCLAFLSCGSSLREGVLLVVEAQSFINNVAMELEGAYKPDNTSIHNEVISSAIKLLITIGLKPQQPMTSSHQLLKTAFRNPPSPSRLLPTGPGTKTISRIPFGSIDLPVCRAFREQQQTSKSSSVATGSLDSFITLLFSQFYLAF